MSYRYNNKVLVQPSPDDVRTARLSVGYSQQQAAELVSKSSYQRWQEWESGARTIQMDTWELFLLKSGLRKIVSNTA